MWHITFRAISRTPTCPNASNATAMRRKVWMTCFQICQVVSPALWWNNCLVWLTRTRSKRKQLQTPPLTRHPKWGRERKGRAPLRAFGYGCFTKQYGMLMSNLPHPPSLITDQDSIFTAYTDCHTSEPITWCKCNLSLVPPNNVKNLLSCLSVWWKHFLRLNLYVYTLSPSLLTSSNQNYYEIYEIQNLIVTCALDDTQFTGKGMTFFLSFSELSFRSSGSIISACVCCCHNRWKILQGTPYPHWASTHYYRSFQHQQEGTGKN